MTEVNQPEMDLIGANRQAEIGMNSQLDSGQIRWMLEGNDIMQRFMANLLRAEINAEGKIVRKIIGYQVVTTEEGTKQEYPVFMSPLMNDVGISDFTTMLYPYLSKNMWLSDFDKFEVAQLVDETLEAVLDTLLDNNTLYEIEEQNLNIIYEICFKYVYPAAKRAEGGGDKIFFSTINKSIEHKITKIEDPNAPQKGGMFSFLKRN
jgi:hypothetical protein